MSLDMDEGVRAHVSKRLRLRRIEIQMSQTDLGKAVGTSFQQIHKYEQGENRISVGRIYQFATALDTTVSYFFDGYEQSIVNHKPTPKGILDKNEAVRLIRQFDAISSDEIKRCVLGMTRAFQVN